MSRTNRWLLTLGLLTWSLSSCTPPAKDGGSGGDTSPDTAEDTGPPGVEPTEGAWSFSRDPLRDRCEGDETVLAIVPILPADTAAVSWEMELTLQGEGFQWEAEDGREVPCAVGGGQAHCVVHEEVIAFDASTDVTIGVWLDGSLPDTSTFAGTESWRMECAGASCATLENMLGTTFPCEASASLSGAAG